jgi:hypothetical protein
MEAGGPYDIMSYKDVTVQEGEKEFALLKINSDYVNLEEEDSKTNCLVVLG